jgi:hypothetical protein
MIPALVVFDARKGKDVPVKPPPPASESKISTPRSLSPFRVPSTDILQTETWIEELHVDGEEVTADLIETEQYWDAFVHPYQPGKRNSHRKLDCSPTSAE